MWDDMNSRLTDHGAFDVSSNLNKDHRTADEENLVSLLKLYLGIQAFSSQY